MLSVKVIGTATSTVKHKTLHGCKLLIVSRNNEPVLAIDTLGAGIGETVLITSDGTFAAKIVGEQATPIRWSVIGIVDDERLSQQ